MKKITLFLAFLCSISAFSATTYLVDNGSGTVWTNLTGPGGTVTHINLSSSAQTLTAWLTATTFASGDQVWITKGTYSVTSAYAIPNSNLTAIYGGFAGTETNTTRTKGTNAWDYTNETVIDGGSAAINLFTESNNYTITIDGLTVTHFGGASPVSYRGGTVVQYCKFINNTVTGPIINYYTTTASMNAFLTSCYFYNNAIASGATTVNATCVYLNNGSSGGTFTVSGCTFESNANAYSTTSGASACLKAQGAGTNNISSCVFKNNSGTVGNSSAVSLGNVNSNLINCLIYGGVSGSKPAMYLTSGNVYNCTCVNNLGNGAFISNSTAANVKLTNTVFWGTDGSASSGSGYISTNSSATAATITNCAYNGIQTAQTPTIPVGTVSLTTSSIPFNNYSAGDYTLAGNSTLIGAGSDLSSSGISGITSDIAGNSRGTSYAIGAYQWASSSVVVTNGGFEDAVSGYTVSESSLNVLRRVAGIADGTTQTSSPTSTVTAVTPGMWVKKAPSTAYISGVISTYDPHSGSNCLNLKIKKGTPNTGYDTWTNAIALQKISLTNTQKYTVSFWAKKDSTSANVASVVTAFITDNVKGTNLSCAIPLTGGTNWTQYSATFDIPTFKAANTTADFTTAFVGVGLTTTYDASTIKTNYSGVLLDDFTISTSNASTVAVATSAVGSGCVVTGGGVYTVGNSATVVASPNNGYKFVNWTLNTSAGAEQSNLPTYTFTVGAATTLVANFVATNTTCTVSTLSLGGFTYNYGSGPSAEQSFTVSGTNLLSNISIAAATDYQISLGSGGSFVPTNPISLVNNGGTVSPTTIYVRLKSGLVVNSYSSNENIAVSTLSSAVQNIVCSGSVTANPGLTFATSTSIAKTYGDIAFANLASSSLSAGAITYVSGNTSVATVDVNSGQVTIVGAGSSVITATIAAYGSYGAATVCYTLNVAKATPTISVSGTMSFTANGLAQGPATISYNGDGTTSLLYTSTDGGGYYSATAPINAGAYQVVVLATAGTNYSAATSSAYTFAITSGAVIVSSNSTLASYSPTSATDVTIDSGYELTVSADANVKSITVAPGAKLTLSSGTLTVATSNGITLQSSSSGTGTLVDNFSSPTVGATVQQYLPQGRNWYVGSPISSGSAGSLKGIGLATSVVYYNESSSGWSTDYSGSLTPGKGYIAISSSGTGTNDIQFAGTLNSGNVPVTLTRQGSTYAGFNLVANPYPSYLNAMAAINANANLVSTIWYRTQSKETTPTFYFETVNTSSGVGTNNAGTGTVTGYIPPMQAFWVRTNVDNQTMTFTNAMRYHANPSTITTTPLKAPKQIQQQLLRLQVSNGVKSDETVLYVDPNASNGYDAYDSQKMSNSSASIPEIFTLAGSEQLVINGMNNVSLNQEIPLGFTTGQSNAFSIRAIEVSNFDAGIQVVLNDNQTNTQWNMTNGSAYNFSSDITSSNTGRFSIVFKTPSITTGTTNNDSETNSVLVYRNSNNLITINCVKGISGQSTVSVYNAIGQRLEEKLLTSSITVLDKSFKAGVYVVSVTVNGKSTTQKVTIN